MSDSSTKFGDGITREALAGRLPTLTRERVYPSYSSFLWTCTAFSAATWAFLIGGFLPYVGDTRIGIFGYLVGVVVGMVPVALASGMPSFRYGLDTIDAAKSSFGQRGMIVPLIGLLATMAGWTYVLMAMTSVGLGNLTAGFTGNEVGAVPRSLLVGIGLVVLVVVWAVASRGPGFFEELSKYIAPGLLVVAAVMLVVLISQVGLGTAWSAQVPAEEAFTTDRLLGFMYAFEFGVANALTWWPAMGGLTRLVKRQNHVLGPSVLGVGVLGAAFISAVAALAGASVGSADPTVWMIDIGGPILGSIVLAFVLIANLASMVIMVYLAGVSIQHIKGLASLQWPVIVGLLLLPGLYFAFRPEWLLEQVMTWLTYNGLMFGGITGITLVDYFILRRQDLDVRQVFAARRAGAYSFWGGVNFVAIAVTAAGLIFYLWIYNPITLEVTGPFRYMGAGLPTIIVSAVLYYVGMRLVALPLKRGGYAPVADQVGADPVPVSF